MLAFCFIPLRGNGDCEPISDLSPSFARARTSPEHDPFLRPIASGVNPSRCLNSRCLTKTISLDSQRALIRDATEYRVRWRNQNRSISVRKQGSCEGRTGQHGLSGSYLK